MSVEPWIDAWPRSARIAAAGPADVAEQELDDRRGTDVLDADRVLRPADRVAERRSSARGPSSRTAPRRPRRTPPRCSRTRRRRAPACSGAKWRFRIWKTQRGCCSVGSSSGGSPSERRAGAAVPDCCPFAREALLAPAGGGVHVHALVLPARRVVLLCSRLPAREEPVEVLGVGEVLADDHRSIRVVDDVLLEPRVVLEDVVDDARRGRRCPSRPGSRPTASPSRSCA